MTQRADVPPFAIKSKRAVNTTNAPIESKRQIMAGRITLNVISTFGGGKLSDILFQIACEKSEQNGIGAASQLWYNNTQTEAKIARPALFSQFGGKL